MASCTTEEFIKKARKVHGDKYDYSKVVYVNQQTKITIICPIHGEFIQTPYKHLKGRGCPTCGHEKVWKSRKDRTDRESAIERLKKIFPNYDYSKIGDVKTQKEKITVICPTHGKFQTTLDALLHGHGCNKCAHDALREKFSLSKEEFIRRAKEIHGDKYDYSKVEYVNVDTKVCIICPTHGEFWQTPWVHIKLEHGCPSCNASHLERMMKKFLHEQKIEYIYQCRRDTFEWLDRQSLDFYLPKYNVAIECQGMQHFEPFSFGSNKNIEFMEKNLEKQKEKDERKRKLCNENGVKLIYFTIYKNVKEDENTFKTTENLLKEIIKSKCLLG